MKLLSVIIPMYNVEPFVGKCIRSLEHQDIAGDDYEIVCVNDGSPDNSREVVLSLQKEFSNIKLIDQENKGVSVARNTGVEKAEGKYLLFVDPDDYVEENSLGRILKDVDSKRAQIAIPGYALQKLNGNMEILKTFFEYGEKNFTGIEAYFLTHAKGQRMTDLAVGIIFEADFLNKYHLRYLPDVVLNQDCELIARVHCLADRCIFVKEILYKSVVRQGSATNSKQFRTDRVRKGFLLAARNLKVFQQEQLLNDRQKVFLNGPIAKFVLLALNSAFKTRSIKKFILTVKVLKQSGLDRLDIKSCSRYNRICGGSYNLSPYLAIFVSYIYLKIMQWSNKNH